MATYHEPWEINFIKTYTDREINEKKLKVLFSEVSFSFPCECQMIDFLNYILSNGIKYHLLKILYFGGDISDMYDLT